MPKTSGCRPVCGTSVISGIIELTNGVYKLSLIGSSVVYIVLASFLLGFGGISVLFQVYSVISKSDISIRPYIYGKFLQATISSLITLVILQF